MVDPYKIKYCTHCNEDTQHISDMAGGWICNNCVDECEDPNHVPYDDNEDYGYDEY